MPVHPMQLMARAYGLGASDGEGGRRVRSRPGGLTPGRRARPEGLRADSGGLPGHVIARKRKRRVALGPFMTLVFECEDTVRFQVQEMARAEKIISDEGIQAELDIYNRLLPDRGALGHAPHRAHVRGRSAEVATPARRDRAALGILRSGAELVRRARGGARRRPDPRTLTPAVHYLRFPFTKPRWRLRGGPRGGPRGPAPGLRGQRPMLPPEVIGLLGDLRGTTKRSADGLNRDDSVHKSLQMHRRTTYSSFAELGSRAFAAPKGLRAGRSSIRLKSVTRKCFP